MTHFRTHLLSAAAIALGLAVSGTAVAAQDFAYGQSLFERHCAACHGLMGEGDGPVTVHWGGPIKNLRQLAKANNSHFPFSEVYQSINGAREIGPHGLKMPVWGDVFTADAVSGPGYSGAIAQEVVQGRILAIVYFLQSIQE